MEHHLQQNPRGYLGHIPDDIQKCLLVLVNRSTHTLSAYCVPDTVLCAWDS